MNNMPEHRRGLLKKKLENKLCIRVMEASNGISGIIVENAKVDNKEYDAIWLSSLCDSVTKGKPDNEVVDFTSRVNTLMEIMEVTTKPIIVDGDTGGRLEHFVNHIRTLERMGVSAIVIEDKTGLKHNSMLGSKAQHMLEDEHVFAKKISLGKKALSTNDFMIFARIESFIAGFDEKEAFKRAKAYVEAGADGIMIHSYKEDGEEIINFLKTFRQLYPSIPLMVVPTTYAHMTENELESLGVNIIIYANHMLRSAYKAMQTVAEMILKDECSFQANKDWCTSIKEILNLVGEHDD